MALRLLILAALAAVLASGAKTEWPHHLGRTGNEIVVCGQLYDIGTRVVLWTDPGGYDAYRVERRFAPWNVSGWEATKNELPDFGSPNRFGMRTKGVAPDVFERVRGGGWDLPSLRKVVTQFVMHYDVTGFAKETFRVLHDHRDLSVQFMLDIDGTIYQTLDVKERGWHAGIANDASVGVEIANIGAYPPGGSNPFDRYYRQVDGRTQLINPPDSGVLTPNFVGYPARNETVKGMMQGAQYEQYDYTPEQYAALARLVAGLHALFPDMALDTPRDPDGRPRTTVLPEAELYAFKGLIGHHHVSAAKQDPGPAFDWDKVIQDAKDIIEKETPREDDECATGESLSRGAVIGISVGAAAGGFLIALACVAWTGLGARLVRRGDALSAHDYRAYT